MNLFKIKNEPEGSVRLDRMYDLIFSLGPIGWAGRIGHYNYGDERATNQDGYIYCFFLNGRYLITADCNCPFINKDCEELSLPEVQK